MSLIWGKDYPLISINTKIEKCVNQQRDWKLRYKEKTSRLRNQVTFFLLRFAKISSEFDKLNNIIQELRKENQNLKQINYELETKLKGTNFTEDKVKDTTI